jgi:hypothetical protein
MSLFAVQIRKEQASLGFLEVTGEPGAGKSTLIEFCWKLMGRDEYEGDDPNKGTVAFFARTLLQVSCLPVGLIEGKRDDEKAGSRRFDYNDLLVFFNGRSPRGTGAKTNGNETYSPPFLGSIYLMQNERIDGIPAVLERLMSLRIDKACGPMPRRQPRSRSRHGRWRGIGTIVHVVRQEAAWMAHFRDRYAHHDHRDKAMRKRVPGLHNARAVKCHSQLAAAVEALPMLFPTCQQAWVEKPCAWSMPWPSIVRTAAAAITRWSPTSGTKSIPPRPRKARRLRRGQVDQPASQPRQQDGDQPSRFRGEMPQCGHLHARHGQAEKGSARLQIAQVPREQAGQRPVGQVRQMLGLRMVRASSEGRMI